MNIVRAYFGRSVARFKKHPVLWTALAVSATLIYFIDCDVADKTLDYIEDHNPNK